MAKEQFRDKIPKGRIKIKYVIDKDKGLYDYWITTAEDLFQRIDSVVDYSTSIGIKLTNRQLYYQLVGKNWIPNADEIYKKVCVFLTDVRYAGLIDWEAIEDKERTPEKKAEWEDIKDLIDSALYSYRLPRWKDQEYYVEMYCEKKAGINVLKPIADKWHIYFGFNKGYSSASAMYDLSKRVLEQLGNGKKVKILYFGDHDASGLDMVRDIRVRLREFIVKCNSKLYYQWDELSIYAKLFAFKIFDENFEVIPVALTMEQIKKYNPPPNPAKITDPRAKWYIQKFGKVSWELDSLDALELRKIAEREVLKYLDRDKYRAWIEKEDKEKKILEAFGKKLVTKKKKEKK